MSRNFSRKPDESTLTTLCPRCLNAFRNARGIRVRRADPYQLTREPCTYCQTNFGYDYRSLVSAPMKLMGTPALFSALVMERFISPMPSTALSARFVQTIIRKKNPRRRKKIVTRFFCQSLAAISCGTHSALASARTKPT